MSKIKLQNVSKNFDTVEAIKDLNLTVKDKEFLVVVGPSGCGKTTLLRLIAGLETLTAGTIIIDKTDVSNIPPEARDIAMAFQTHALFPNMTVKRNLELSLILRKLKRKEIDKKVNKVVELLELQDLLDRKPNELSGGQQQKVSFGRAIVRQPNVFLFDEPFSNFDAYLRARTRSELRKILNKVGITAIYVTHDQDEALSMADRICVLNDGVIQQIGTPKEILEKPVNQFVSDFFKTPVCS